MVKIPYEKVRLETDGGEFVQYTFILPFNERPKVLIWGERVFLHHENNIYRECFYCMTMPNDYLKKAFGLKDEDFK